MAQGLHHALEAAINLADGGCDGDRARCPVVGSAQEWMRATYAREAAMDTTEDGAAAEETNQEECSGITQLQQQQRCPICTTTISHHL